MDVEVEDIEAELWAGWLGQRCGGVAGKARRSTAELAENKGGGKERSKRVEEASEASMWCVVTCGRRWS